MEADSRRRKKFRKSGHYPKERRKRIGQKEKEQETHAEEFSKPSQVKNAQWNLLVFIK